MLADPKKQAIAEALARLLLADWQRRHAEQSVRTENRPDGKNDKDGERPLGRRAA